jgi:hypothetical protein
MSRKVASGVASDDLAEQCWVMPRAACPRLKLGRRHVARQFMVPRRVVMVPAHSNGAARMGSDLRNESRLFAFDRQIEQTGHFGHISDHHGARWRRIDSYRVQ